MNGQTRRDHRLLRGLGALAATTVLVAGLPVGLYCAEGNPLSLARQAGSHLLSPDDGTVLLDVVTVVAWIAWAVFSLSVLAEFARQISGARWGLPGPQQRMAGVLVAAVLGAFIASTVTATHAARIVGPTHTATAPAAAAVAPQQMALVGDTVVHHADVRTAHHTYTVHKGDYLGSIAQRYEGDFDAYPELAAANHIGNPDLIHPGEHILLPSDAVDHGVRTHATGHLTAATAPATDHKAPAGDSPNSVDSPPGTPAADPSTPTTQEPTPAPMSTATAAPTTAAATPPATSSADEPTEQPVAAGPQQPEDHGSATEDAVMTAAVVGGILAACFLALLTRRRRKASQHRRLGRQLKRPPHPATEVQARAGQRPQDTDRLDRAVRHLATALQGQPADRLPDIAAAWMDDANVALILTAPMPAIRPWIGADDGHVWMMPAETPPPSSDAASALPALFTFGTGAEGTLFVDAERAGLLTIGGDATASLAMLRHFAAEAATCSWADNPTVIVAGLDEDETRNLIDLNPHRVITRPVSDVCTSLMHQARIRNSALQAAGAADALDARINHDVDTTQLVFIADPDGAHTALLTELDAALANAPRLGLAVVAVTQQPGSWHIDLDEAAMPDVTWLTVSGTTVSQLTAAVLADLADTIRTAVGDPGPLGGIEQAEIDEQPPPADPALGAWAADVDTLGSPLYALHPSADVRNEPTVDLGVSNIGAPEGDVSAEPLAPVTELVPRRQRLLAPNDPELDTDFAAWQDETTQRPRIAILGEPVVLTTGFPPAERERFHAEIVVLLASRGTRGATNDELSEMLYGDDQSRPLPKSIRTRLGDIRRWLGNGPDGPWLPPITGKGDPYVLRQGYLLDWHLFLRLKARGIANESIEDLHNALGLVRGAPLYGAERKISGRNPYPWLADSPIMPWALLAGIADAVHHLVDHCLADGDIPGARWAAAQGQLADPDGLDDVLYRARIRIAAAAGNNREAANIVDELIARRDAEVPEDLATETYRLLQDLNLLPAA